MNNPYSIKKKILFVLQHLEIGGAEQLKLTTEKYINQDKYGTVYCCIKRIGAIGREIIKKGGNVVTLNSNDKFYNLIATYKLYKLARKIRPDLIHSALFNANFHARIVGILLRMPVIIEEHGMYTWKRWYHILINRLLANFTYKIIVPSRHVKNFLIAQEGLDFDKIMVFLNCIDSEFLKSKAARAEGRMELSVADNDFVIGAVGTLRKEKGHIYLLQAMRLILYSYSEIKILIVGEGPLKRKLEVFVQQNHLRNSVKFMGSRRDIPLLLKAMDIFVSPAIKEAFGINLIEAMYTGLPCVATNIGGIPEVIIDGETGRLVPPANPEALAKAIKELLNKPELAKKYGEAGKKRVLENFTADKYIRKLENLYNGLLTKGLGRVL